MLTRTKFTEGEESPSRDGQVGADHRRKNNRRQRLRKDDGRPNPNSKLTDALEEKLCALIQKQLTLTDACDVLDVNRTTIWEWRSLGQRNPASRCGKFERRITKAYALAKSSLIRDIARHPDLEGKIFLLKNRYPAEYRDRVYQEIAGPEGAPIPVAANPFQVNIVMSGDPDTKFTVVDHSARKRTRGHWPLNRAQRDSAPQFAGLVRKAQFTTGHGSCAESLLKSAQMVFTILLITRGKTVGLHRVEKIAKDIINGATIFCSLVMLGVELRGFNDRLTVGQENAFCL